MNKCEWKDGKFEGCEGFNGNVRCVQDYQGKWQTVCHSCHTDIRKPEPKAPSHEEIMTMWWKIGDRWRKVETYDVKSKEYFIGAWQAKWTFTNRTCALIPPPEVK